MLKLTQKNNLKIFLKNTFFEDSKDLLKEIIDRAFFTVHQRAHFRKNNDINSWAFDFRIPLLESDLNKSLFSKMSEYLSSSGYQTLALKGIGAMPFISLNQHSNIKNILIIRDTPKTYGFRQEIEGKITNKIDPICVLDDIINSGNNILQASNILKKHEFNIGKYFSLVNFKWGKKKINIELIDSILEIDR
jgi:hypothetical protein